MKLTLLAGGVGGGRMAEGFYQHCHSDLTVVVNVGDDFVLHGLNISPDLDTVLYTLAVISNMEQGWGLDKETFRAHEMLRKLGQPDWFSLGDQDLAVHIARTQWMREGLTLTEITAKVAQSLGVTARVLPVTDQSVATWVELAEAGEDGERFLSFQDYFVKRRHKDPVQAFQFRGSREAQPGPDVLSAIESAAALVLAPSNPFVSIDPILSIPGVRKAVAGLGAPRVAVSPIVGGEAIKGPAASMLRDLGFDVSCRGVASYYEGLIDGIVIDTIDHGYMEGLRQSGLKVLCTDTIMRGRSGRARLAGAILHWVEQDFQ